MNNNTLTQRQINTLKDLATKKGNNRGCIDGRTINGLLKRGLVQSNNGHTTLTSKGSALVYRKTSRVKGYVMKLVECRKCQGRGRIDYFNYYEDGRCFDCDGQGRREETVMVAREETATVAKLPCPEVGMPTEKQAMWIKRACKARLQGLSETQLLKMFKMAKNMHRIGTLPQERVMEILHKGMEKMTV